MENLFIFSQSLSDRRKSVVPRFETSGRQWTKPDFVIIFDSKYKKSCSGVLFPRSPFLSTHHKLISKQEIRFITSPKMRAKISEILIFSFFSTFFSIFSMFSNKNMKKHVFSKKYYFHPTILFSTSHKICKSVRNRKKYGVTSLPDATKTIVFIRITKIVRGVRCVFRCDSRCLALASSV